MNKKQLTFNYPEVSVSNVKREDLEALAHLAFKYAYAVRYGFCPDSHDLGSEVRLKALELKEEMPK